MRLITSFKNHQDATIILVTHNPDYLSLSDHRLFIKDGTLSVNEGGFSIEENHAELSASIPQSKLKVATPKVPVGGKK